MVDRAALLEYQSERLRQLIRHAYDSVPFTGVASDEYGVRPGRDQGRSLSARPRR